MTFMSEAPGQNIKEYFYWFKLKLPSLANEKSKRYANHIIGAMQTWVLEQMNISEGTLSLFSL